MTKDKYENNILAPTPTCMYCHVSYYIEKYSLGDQTHGICNSPLCALELILDNSPDEETFNKNLVWMDEQRKRKNGT